MQTDSTTLRITILVDNHCDPGLASEHGLSFWIEHRGRCILFDTGQGPALKPNARALGIGLERAELLVLSHGHFDHTGGLAQVINGGRRPDLYCHPAVVAPRYAVRNGVARAIQMPRASMAAIDKLSPGQLHWVVEPVMLDRDMGLSGPIPRETDYEDTGGPFFLDSQGRRADPIEDDLALWVRTRQGLVVCVGCCHAGLINTLRHVRRLGGEERIHAVIGGFHLIAADRRRLEMTAAALRDLAPERIIPGHCTGDHAVGFLQDAFPERVSPAAAGMVFLF